MADMSHSLDKAILEGRPLNMAEMLYVSKNLEKFEDIQAKWDAKLKDDTALKAREMQAKADLARAAETEARANELLEKLSQKEVQLEDLRQSLDTAKIELEQREKAANRDLRTREENLTRREKSITPREESAAVMVQNAKNELEKALTMQGEVEEMKAKLREIVA